MNDIKIKILNRQHAELVIEHLFELGCEWCSSEADKNIHTECVGYQIVRVFGRPARISGFLHIDSFKESPKKEVDLEYLQELVSIKRGYSKVEKKTNQHPHRDIINAMLENTDLIALRERVDKWAESSLSRVAHDKDGESYFFICHKSNMGICLHWLNGGAIECESSNGEWLYIAPPTNDEISMIMTHSLMTNANEKLRVSKVKKYSVISKIPMKNDPAVMISKRITTKEEADQLAKTMQDAFPDYQHEIALIEEI